VSLTLFFFSCSLLLFRIVVNDIDADGAKIIGERIRKNKVITVLDLGCMFCFPLFLVDFLCVLLINTLFFYYVGDCRE